MSNYKNKLWKCVITYIIIFIAGSLINSTYIDNTTALIYGFICTCSACLITRYVIKTMGFQRALLCVVAGTLAPIWFLYLEGLLEKEGTASMLDPYLRVRAYSIAVLYQAFYIAAYVVSLSIVSKLSLKINSGTKKIDLNAFYAGVCTILACLVPLFVIGSQYPSLDELWVALTAGRQGSESGTLLRRSEIGGSEALLLPFMWLWQLTPALASIALTINIQQKRFFSIITIIACFCGLAVTFFTFLGGSRGALMFVIAVPMMLWFYYGIKHGAKFWIPTIALFFAAIGVMEFQVKTRGNILDQFSSRNSDATEEVTFNPLKSHRDNNLYFLSLVVDGVPDSYSYEGYGDFFAYLVNPIPRSIWPSKPILAGALGKEEVKAVYASGPLIVGTSSLTSSVVGQAYLWGGVIGFMPIVIIYGMFSAWFDVWFLRTLEPKLVQIAIQGFAAFMMFWGFRDFGTFVTFIYPFLVMYIVFLFVSIFYSKKNYLKKEVIK